MNKKLIFKMFSIVLIMLGTVALAALILMGVLKTCGINFDYPTVLGIWGGILGVVLITKFGRIIWDYIAMTSAMLLARRKFQKDLAEKEDLIKKHFTMFGGNDGSRGQ